MTPEPRRRWAWAGALAMLAFLGLLAGLGASFVPTGSSLGPAARILDSLAPWLLALALGVALAATALGLRRTGPVLVLALLAGAGQMAWTHWQISLPLVPRQPADLRVLFFNVLNQNAAYSHRIVAAALELEPDVIVLAEAEAIYPALPALTAHHEFVSPCPFEACGLLVASRRAPVRFWQLSLNSAFEDRYAVAELETLGGKRVFVAASHLTKPWLSGISEPELRRLAAQYDWLSEPVVAVGDFNAAPWSRPMRELLEFTGFRALRRPFGSWPAAAGGWGIPIDHVLVHNGARVVQIRPFGAEMNSNHRGFYVDVALP